ncbi:AlpA family transcriptional regulator [Cupriavidus sp. DB3]|uniref:helix-turn-helix transcriptional regulator n=1 Tax=Cupriavidus sp. DB3 TaxID=2873259 RepID=UPI001CF5358A|nr:AlpA family phage regulatory protein [Cupriavidus sp. DB3]MCA7085823.1 AlpA family transcriptional regulator [Cupriavidus sp. DB3]
MATENALRELAILRRKEVQALTGLSRSSIYQRLHESTFPRPVNLGRRAVGWRAADIEAWLRDPSSYRSS